MKFYRCNHCGAIIIRLIDAGKQICCGEPMSELKPGVVDAATEKHVPVVEVEGASVTVKVGEVEHPMTEEHLIQFVVLETKQGYQVRNLTASDAPVARFVVAEGDEAVAAYEYCNLHGLWKKEI